jgi:two-component system, OmpR family, sensor histidine kinase VanS
MLKGVVRKIFISINLLLLFFFIVQMTVQTHYIDVLYRNASINKTKAELRDLISDFSNSSATSNDIDKITKAYTLNTEAPLLIIDGNLNIINTSFFDEFNTVTIRLGESQRAYIIIDYLKKSENFSSDDLYYGARILLEGTKIGNSQFIEPLTINLNRTSYVNKESTLSYKNQASNNKPLYFSGYITQIKVISREESTLNYLSKVLYKEMLNFFWSEDSIANYSQTNNEKALLINHTDNFFVMLVDKKTINGSTLYFLTLDKIEKISFAFNTLYPYYLLFYALGFVLLVIISFFYSKWISAPLLHLNHIAKKISDLDFSTKSNIKSKDELGELSNSLNSLSANLKKNIEELNNSNAQLFMEAMERAENEKKIRHLLTNLSHEFKTPLSIISGFVNILNDGVNEKESHYYYKIIMEEIDRLNYLISNTLHLSKEEVHDQLILEDFSINELIDNTLCHFEEMISHKKIVLDVQLDLFIVNADKAKIQQVLINLISNAIKYAHPYTVLSVKTKPQNSKIMIMIENEGHIEERDLEKIWNRYYRTEGIKKNTHEGSGLGLSITKNILEMHSSTYGVKNINQRIQFYFSLHQ